MQWYWCCGGRLAEVHVVFVELLRSASLQGGFEWLTLAVVGVQTAH